MYRSGGGRFGEERGGGGGESNAQGGLGTLEKGRRGSDRDKPVKGEERGSGYTVGELLNSLNVTGSGDPVHPIPAQQGQLQGALKEGGGRKQSTRRQDGLPACWIRGPSMARSSNCPPTKEHCFAP